MMRMVFGAAMFAAATNPASAQGFSGSGAAGVAQSQGVTASSGFRATDRPDDARALAPEPGFAPIRGVRRVDTAYAPRRGRPLEGPRPW